MNHSVIFITFKVIFLNNIYFQVNTFVVVNILAI